MECNFKIVYTPLIDNKFHSDILIGEKATKGNPLSPKISEATRILAEKSEFIDE